VNKKRKVNFDALSAFASFEYDLTIHECKEMGEEALTEFIVYAENLKRRKCSGAWFDNGMRDGD